MPNYTASDLVKAQIILDARLAPAENRERVPSVWSSFAERDDAFQLQVLNRTREDRPATDAIFNNRTSRVLGTARTYNHTGSKADSSVLNLTWLERTDKFNISLKQGDNNVLSNSVQLANEFEQLFLNFSTGLETIASDFVVNNRSQISTAVAESAFDGITFVNEITDSTKGTRAMQITRTAMLENKYNKSARFVIFMDSVGFNRFQQDSNQGAGNSTNLAYQFGNAIAIESIEMNALAAGLGYTKGFWVVVQDGFFGAPTWIPKQNREGKVTKENMYSSLINPIDNRTYAVHSYETRADDSANNGFTQDVVTQWEVSIDLAPELAPLTTANETVLQAFALI